MYFLLIRSYLYRRDSVRLHRRRSISALIEQEAPTTAPKDWPGKDKFHIQKTILMKFVLSRIGIKIFTGAAKDQENTLLKLRILLVEILISVYMSLLIYALSTDDCSTIYRLLIRKWSTAETAVRLWYGVFGGGAKKPRPTQPISKGSGSPSK